MHNVFSYVKKSTRVIITINIINEKQIDFYEMADYVSCGRYFLRSTSSGRAQLNQCNKFDFPKFRMNLKLIHSFTILL